MSDDDILSVFGVDELFVNPASARTRVLDALAHVPLQPHPGSPHEFVTRCVVCGENGFLNVALVTHNERVTISEERP